MKIGEGSRHHVKNHERADVRVPVMSAVKATSMVVELTEDALFAAMEAANAVVVERESSAVSQCLEHKLLVVGKR